MAAIVAHGLTKDFGHGRGIFDLDLEVGHGRVFGFLGPNGAGKTTTIRLLMDYLRPTRGSATILGMDPTRDAVRIRERLGFIPGELQLPAFLRGKDYLDESARLRGGVDTGWRDELVALLGAELQPKIRTLSKGNRQKLALIDALQHRPDLLILDEPTDGLDPLLRSRVQEVLRQHAADGGTVFMSSHVVHEIQTTCQDVSIVIAGRLRRVTSVEALLLAEPAVVEADVPDVPAAVARLYQVPGVLQVLRRGARVRAHHQGPILPLMQALIELAAQNVSVHPTDLEETFLRLFAEEAVA